MKNVSLMLLAALLLPVGLFAESPSAQISARGGEFWAKKVQQASIKASKEESQKVAVKESVRAADSLKKLISAYPENASLINELVDDHTRLVAAAGQTEREDNVFYQKLTYELEYLYQDFIALQKADENVASQVREIINHGYWVNNAQRLMTISALKEKILDVFTIGRGSKTPYCPLKINGDEWLSSLK